MSEAVDLSVKLADIKLRNPFIVGSGPTVKNADQIREAQDGGWAADCSLKTLEEARRVAKYIVIFPTITYDGLDPEKCTACGLCWKIGHCTAISHPDRITWVDFDHCMGSSTCVDICPRGAVSMVATD